MRNRLVGCALALMMLLTSQAARASVVYDLSFTPTVMAGYGMAGGIGELVLAAPVGAGQQDYEPGAAVSSLTVTVGGHFYDLTNSFKNIRFLNGSLVSLQVGQTPIPYSFAANGLQYTFFDQRANSSTNGTLSASLQIAAPVPEPSTWAMMVLGFAGVGLIAYRRRKQAVEPSAA